MSKNYYNLYLKYKKKYFELKNKKFNLLSREEHDKSFLFNHIFLNLLKIFDLINESNRVYLYDGYISIFGGAVLKYYLFQYGHYEISEDITTDMDITIIYNNDSSKEFNFKEFYDIFNLYFNEIYPELDIRYEYTNGLYIVYINGYQIIDVNIYNIQLEEETFIDFELTNSMKEYAIKLSDNGNSVKEFFINTFNRINKYIYDNRIISEEDKLLYYYAGHHPYSYMMPTLYFEQYSILKGIDNMIEFIQLLPDRFEFIKNYENGLLDTQESLNIRKYERYKSETKELYIINKRIKLKRYILKLLLLCKVIKKCDNSFLNYLELSYYREKLDNDTFLFIKDLFSHELFQ
jgi:hypothetical protein